MSKPCTGTFKIVSLTEGNPATGVGFGLSAFQTVHLNHPIQVWKLEQQAGDRIFRFSIGGYRYTGVLAGNVTATIYTEQKVKWHVTYREVQDAYTIELDEDHTKGWTVSLLQVPDFDINPAIEIKPIVVHHTFPARFLPSQLFRFEPVDE